jgi:lysyl-tRNA synthetase class 2
MDLLADFAKEMFGVSDVERVRHREAFQRYAGFDPAGQNALKMEISSGGWVDVDIDLWMIKKVQPNLGLTSPAILYDYPAAEAALAVVRHDDHGSFAERFELFYRGVELANGYHELLDPAVLMQRNARVNQLRELDGKPRLPEESRLLAAMRHGLPPCAGCALGVDRLVMLLAGTTSIQEVMAFPIDRA